MIRWAHSQGGAPQLVRRPFRNSLQCQLSTLYRGDGIRLMETVINL